MANTAAWRSHFDYSLGSGEALDQFIELMIGAGDPLSDALVMGMGAYLGETFIRNLGGEWAAMPSGPTPEDPGIEWNGLEVFPYEKVRKRIALGPEHSVAYFLRETADTAHLDPSARASRWRRFRRGK